MQPQLRLAELVTAPNLVAFRDVVSLIAIIGMEEQLCGEDFLSHPALNGR